MKLTPKQKEVIKKMREGCKLSMAVDYAICHMPNGMASRVWSVTFNGLLSKLIIEKSSFGKHGEAYYTLTEQGKTIDL